VAYLYRDNYPSNKVDILHNSSIRPWFILAIIKLMYRRLRNSQSHGTANASNNYLKRDKKLQD